jgi:hypothetical protein
MSDLRKLATPEQKAKLRKTRKLPGKVKEVVYKGNKGGTGPVTQFNQDIALYGLWEALLYVEGYEQEEGYYVPGTAEKAFQAAVS